MIRIYFSRKFNKSFKKLSREIKEKALILVEIFQNNPFAPTLHSKRLQGKLNNLFSFRITRDYRLVFRFVAKNEVEFLLLKHRKDIYKNL